MTSDRRRRLAQGALVGAVLGLLLSQYAPIFGDARPRAAAPWSPLRKTLAGHHMIVFALVGLALGYGAARARDE